MRLDSASTPTFAHHQTFHPRFGWITKGFSRACSDPGVFLAENATVRLGVGKNMVSAIRFWTAAVRVLARVPAPDSKRIHLAVPTPLGRALLGDEGYDPYIEDLATMWILHWHLVSAVTDVPVWWLTLNDFTPVEFSEAELLEFATDEVLASSFTAPNPSSISKDVDCLLHMYAPRAARARQGIDDLIDSPFRELELITASPGQVDRYRFNRGLKPGLSAEVIVYCCLDYLARNEPDARTATLTHLATGPGTPGRLLKLTEDTMLAAFETVVAKQVDLSLTSPAGAPQLAYGDHPALIAGDVLFAHYEARRDDVHQQPGPVAGPLARLAEPASSGVSHVGEVA